MARQGTFIGTGWIQMKLIDDWYQCNIVLGFVEVIHEFLPEAEAAQYWTHHFSDELRYYWNNKRQP